MSTPHISSQSEIAALREELDRTRAALAVSESRLRRLFWSNPLPMWIYHRDSLDILAVNDAAQAHYGWSRNEFLALNMRDMLVPGDSAGDDLLLPCEGLAEHEPCLHRCKDGRVIEVEVTSHGLDYNGAPARVVMARDVTEARRAAAALRASEDRLRHIVEHMPVMLDALDAQGLVMVWNQECERVTGYSATEIVGNPAAFELLYPNPAYRQMMLSEWQRRGQNYRDWEWDLRARDGSTRRVAWSNLSEEYPIPGWHAWGIGIDVTARHEAETRMRDYARRLETLSRRLMDVQETERRHVARELHDEVGQALTAVKLNLQSLQRHGGISDGDARVEDSVGLVDQAIHLVRQLSAELRPSILDDLGLVPALRWYLDRQAGRSGLAMVLEASQPLPALDPRTETTCFRLVQEAVTNAVRHAGASRVVVRLYEEFGELALDIADDGRGFDVEVARAAARAGASVGLGSMEERVMLLGGRLDIEARPGRGCTVSARLAGAACP